MWNSPKYKMSCCLLAAQQLNIDVYETDNKTYTKNFLRIAIIAENSVSDVAFFYKVKMLSSIKPLNKQTKETDIDMVQVPALEMKEVQESEDNTLSSLFETTYNNIREH